MRKTKKKRVVPEGVRVMEGAELETNYKLVEKLSPLQVGKTVRVSTLMGEFEGRVVSFNERLRSIVIRGAFPNAPIINHIVAIENIVSAREI